jgi:hypothetical protein
MKLDEEKACPGISELVENMDKLNVNWWLFSSPLVSY